MTLDASAFTKWLGKAAKKLEAQTSLALRRTAEAAATYARLSKQYKSHTYGLRKSIHTKPGKLDATVVADAPYAHFVENGTKRHPIEPKDRGSSPRQRQWLRFEVNGQMVFARKVDHPGTYARPFMREAQERATPLFSRLVAEAATNAFS
jgi:hypothetical protein